MPLGFALLFVGVFLVAIALLLGPVFALWSWLNGKRANQPSILRALQAGLLPFVWILTGFSWFFVQAIYSEGIRGVDCGLGDSWHVPLQNGYSFYSFDGTDEGGLTKDGGSVVVERIHRLIEDGNFIVGTKDDSTAFSLDTRNGTVRHYKDVSELISQFSALPPLKSTLDFYMGRRWGYQDLVLVFLLGLLLSSVTRLWYRLFIR